MKIILYIIFFLSYSPLVFCAESNDLKEINLLDSNPKKNIFCENNPPFFYRLFTKKNTVDPHTGFTEKKEQETKTYILGTCHIVPFSQLPKLVQKIIKEITRQDNAYAISECGNDKNESEDQHIEYDTLFAKLLEIEEFKNNDPQDDNWIEHIECIKEVIGPLSSVLLCKSEKLLEIFSQLKPFIALEVLNKMSLQIELNIIDSGELTGYSERKGMDRTLSQMFKKDIGLDTVKLRFESDLENIKEKSKTLDHIPSIYGLKVKFKFVCEKLSQLLSKEKKYIPDEEFLKLLTDEYENIADNINNPNFILPKADSSITYRNMAWLNYLSEDLRGENAQIPKLIYVGRLHLEGPRGLLELLEEVGFIIKKIKRDPLSKKIIYTTETYSSKKK